MKEKKKGTWSTILLIIMLVVGLSLLLYPTVSEAWNARFRNRAIAYYADSVANLDDGRYDAIWEAAKNFNKELNERYNEYTLTEEQETEYVDLLNVSGDGTMGYIEIPSINCALPIYHGTSETVLQVAVGHLEWTSLPTGGASTHTVLSGHRGLPSAKLFTDLDKLVLGDKFILRILNETLTYEVDQILIVLPNETDSLLIQEGKDLCTLVTCTPYGVNSHRLLVRGHRVANDADTVNVRVTSDAIQVEPLLIACFIGIPILGAMLILMSLLDKLRDD
jgi:sortase A